jgi:hypothetical protein
MHTTWKRRVIITYSNYERCSNISGREPTWCTTFNSSIYPIFSTLYMFRALCAHLQERQNCFNTASVIVNSYWCAWLVTVGMRLIPTVTSHVRIRGYFSKPKGARKQKDWGTLHYRVVSVGVAECCINTFWKRLGWISDRSSAISTCASSCFPQTLCLSRQKSAYYLN